MRSCGQDRDRCIASFFTCFLSLSLCYLHRLLQTNIMFRSDNGFARVRYLHYFSPKCSFCSEVMFSVFPSYQPTVFGHPAILNLPSSGLGESLYTTVGVLVPHPLTEYEWTLNLTDSKVNCLPISLYHCFSFPCPSSSPLLPPLVLVTGIVLFSLYLPKRLQRL